MIPFSQFEAFLGEQAYKGNIGVMEITAFFTKATADQKKMLSKLIDQKKNDAAWELISSVTGVKLQKV